MTNLESVVNCLQTHNFLSHAREKRIPISFLSPALFELAKTILIQECGIEPPFSSISDKDWRLVYKAVLMGGERREREGVEAGYITPASAVYIILYELYGSEATRKMYDLLEDLMVAKLMGNGGTPIEYLFFPVSEAYLQIQLRALYSILSREPSICSHELFSSVLCSKSKLLSHKGVKVCHELTKRTCDKVKSGGEAVA